MAPADPTPKPAFGQVETVYADSRVVACDGSEGPLGHPRVWLRIEGTQTYCPYCSRLFVLRDGAGDHPGH